MKFDRIYQIILENMQEQVYVRDRDKTIIYINPSSEKLTGWSLEKAIGKKCYEIFGDADLTCKEICPVEKAFSDNQHIYHHEGKLKTRLGDERDMKVSISPLCEDDIVTGAVVVMNDITLLKEIEQTHVKNLIQLEQERNMFFKGPVVVFKWQNKSGWPVEYASSNVEDVLGYSIKEWNSQKIRYSDIIFKEDKQRVADEIVLLAKSATNRFDREPYRLIKKDGTAMWALDYTTVIKDESGGITHYLGYVVDISERMKLENKLNKLNHNLKEKVTERTAELEDMNTALKVLLDKSKSDKLETEKKIVNSYEFLIIPFLDRLKNRCNKKNQQILINIVESTLKDITTPFARQLSDPLTKLTPKEIQVSDMVKKGYSNKEMAEILNNSIRTITKHRDNIREKLDLKNKKINLRSYLSSI